MIDPLVTEVQVVVITLVEIAVETISIVLVREQVHHTNAAQIFHHQHRVIIFVIRQQFEKKSIEVVVHLIEFENKVDPLIEVHLVDVVVKVMIHRWKIHTNDVIGHQQHVKMMVMVKFVVVFVMIEHVVNLSYVFTKHVI